MTSSTPLSLAELRITLCRDRQCCCRPHWVHPFSQIRLYSGRTLHRNGSTSAPILPLILEAAFILDNRPTSPGTGENRIAAQEIVPGSSKSRICASGPVFEEFVQELQSPNMSWFVNQRRQIFQDQTSTHYGICQPSLQEERYRPQTVRQSDTSLVRTWKCRAIPESFSTSPSRSQSLLLKKFAMS